MEKTGWLKKIGNTEKLTMDESSEKNEVPGGEILPDPYRPDAETLEVKGKAGKA